VGIVLIGVGSFAVAEVAARGDIPPQIFVDATNEAGLIAVNDPSDNYLQHVMNLGPMIGGGAVGDFNNDGWQDFFFMTGGTGLDKLFINNQDGTFTDRAVAWGLTVEHMGVGASVADFDNDGDLDIYITSMGPTSGAVRKNAHRLYVNNGDDTFSNRANAAGVKETSAVNPDGFGSAWGDYDLDGDLDLFVCGWTYTGLGNRLFKNNGDGTFEDVTVGAGLWDLGARGFSPVFADMDGDLYPELLIAGDFHQSRYWVNNGDGTFADHKNISGTCQDDNGMGHALADVDGDGDLDWYVTSIYVDEFPWSDVPGTGNMLYLNDGDHQYTEVSVGAGVNNGGWGWGAVGVDFDHDGREDLIETNGWFGSNQATEQEWIGERSYVFRSNGDGTFSEVSAECGFNHTAYGRGLIRFDADNDGDQDMVVIATGGPLKFFRNELISPGARGGSGVHWLRVLFDTSEQAGLAPDGYGTRVEAVVGERTHMRMLTGGASYLAQSELSVHFGLGDATTIDLLRVRWADGRSQVYTDVLADQSLVLSPRKAGDADDSGAVDVGDIIMVLKNLGGGEHEADTNGDKSVDVNDISYVLFRIGQ
jgi:hypothetical protein